MTTLDQTIQYGKVPRTYGLFQAGQVASANRYQFMSARYDQTGNTKHPLKFGYACSHAGVDPSHTGNYNTQYPDTDQNYTGTGGRVITQGVKRTAVAKVAASPTPTATVFALEVADPRYPVAVGSEIMIGTETKRVTAIAANGNLTVGAFSTAPAAGAEVYLPIGGPNDFAGVIYRDRTRPGRFNTDELDAYLDGEIASVFTEGDIVCVFNEAVPATALDKPVGVIGSGTNMGRFTTAIPSDVNIFLPNSRVITQSERVGTTRGAAPGNSDIYLAVVRFTQ